MERSHRSQRARRSNSYPPSTPQRGRRSALAKIRAATAIYATVAAAASCQFARAVNWNGGTAGNPQDWNTLANWSASPNGADTFINVGSSGNYPIVTGTSLYTPSFLHVAWGTSGTPTGQLVVNGTLTTTGMTINDSQNNTTGANGKVIINSGGTLNSTNDTLISFAGSGSAVGELDINAGGTFNIGTSAEKWLIVNQWDTAQGKIDVNGGALNLLNGTDIRFSISGGTGTSFVTVENGGTITGNAGSVIDLNRNGTAGNNTVNLNGGTAAGVVTIGQIVAGGTTGTRAFNFNGGTLKAAGASTAFFAAGVASAATVNSSGGTIDNAGFAITIGQVFGGVGGLTFTDSGAAAVTTLSGVNTFTGATAINGGTLLTAAGNSPASGALSKTSSITVNNGGTLKSTENGLFGYDGTATHPITVNSGGTLTADAGVNINVGTVTLNGGTLTNAGSAPVWGSWTFRYAGGKLAVTDNSTMSAQNVFMKNGTTVDVDPGKTLLATGTFTNASSDGSGALVKTGAGSIVLTGANSYSGTTTISAGTLQLGNGGTTGSLAAGSAIVNNGNLTINRSNAVTQGTDFGSAAITGSGSFTQAGSGTTTFTAANAYSGTTSINAGRLDFTAAQSSGLGGISLADGTTLGVQRVAAGTTVSSTGGLMFGTSASTNLALNFNALANPTAALAAFNGAITRNGTINVTLSNFGGLTTATNIPLLTYASETGSGGFKLSTTTSGHTSFALNDTSTALYLNVTAIVNKWTGTTSATWDINSSTNWNAPDQRYLDGDNVLFDETGSNRTIDLAANINPASVTVSNSNYSFNSSGNFGIGGTGVLTKNGTGTLTLNTVNAYTGGTTVNAGTLVINNASSLGAASGALTLNAGTLETTADITTTRNVTLGDAASAVQVDPSTTYTVNGVLSGTGTLNKNGNGTLTLGGTNTYSGGTLVNGGVLSVAANANLGASAGGVTLDSGGTLTTTAFFIDSHPITINSGGGTINVTTNGQLYLNAANLLLGTGGLTLTGGNGTLTANVGNLRIDQTNTYAGAVTIRSGGIFEYGTAGAVASGANFTLGNEGELADQGGGSVSFPNAITVAGGTNSVLSFENGTAGAFSGPITLNANVTVGLRDWYNNATVRSGTISGAISGNGGLIVNSGSGTNGVLTLSGANTFTGNITATGSSSITLSGAGQLGAGSYAGNIAMAGGTLTLAGTNDQTLSGVLSGTNAVVKSGSASLVLSNANTFSGGTTISGGSVVMADPSALGTNSTATSVNFTGGTVGSTLDVATNGSDTAYNLNFGSNGGAGTTVNIASNLKTGSVGINHTLGTLTAGVGTFNVTAGSHVTSGSPSISLGAVNMTTGFGGATTFNPTTASLTLASVAANLNNNGKTLVLGGTNPNNVITGPITVTVGTLAVAKTGSSTWTLNGNSTYGGDTTINGGDLRANNAAVNASDSATGTGRVTINSTGTLGGTGSTGAVTVASGGTITAGSGGNNIGALSVGAASFNGGGTYLVKVNNVSGSAGSGWDKLTMSSLDLSTLNTGNKFTIKLTSFAGITQGVAANFDGAHNVSFLIGHVNDANFVAPTNPSDLFALDTSSFAQPAGSPGGTFALSFGSNASAGDFYVSYQASPEPTTALLFGGGAASLLLGRRRRDSRTGIISQILRISMNASD